MKRSLQGMLLTIWCICLLQTTVASASPFGGRAAAVETGEQGNIPGTPRVVYVDQQVAVSGDGSSWALAYKTLSDALSDAAGSLTTDSILVAAGTYYPTGQQTGTDRDSSFLILRSGIKIYGGYPSGGGVRDTALNATVLSGNIGDPDNVDDNSVHVLVVAGVGLSADSIVLDGLSFNDAAGSAVAGSTKTYNGVAVLRPGGGGVNCSVNANENIVFRNCSFSKNVLHTGIGGAGMYITAASPLITNCTFASNSGSGNAGGIFVDNASPIINHCTFEDNSIAGRGGGIYNYNNAAPMIINCNFTGNVTSETRGSAIYNNNSSPSIINCTFSDNLINNFNLTNSGGTIYNLSSSPVITLCKFTSNECYGLGGAGILNYNSSPVITSCLFAGNASSNPNGNGGGINNLGGSSPTIVNCLFSGNYAGRGGGALYNNSSTYTMINCTIARNYCGVGGAIFDENATTDPVIKNCIIWGNDAIADPGIYTDGSTLSFAYSDVQSLASGSNENINADPLFVNAPPATHFSNVDGDYHLQSGSPAINAGNNAFNSELTDIDIKPRVFDAIIDMGAYEFQESSLPVTLVRFGGVLQNGRARLEWQTGVETGFSRFQLAKSSDGATFSTVASIPATGSNSKYSYELSQSEERTYYRLKMTDDNGKYKYSDIVTLTQKPGDNLAVYPNPATDYIKVQAPVAGTLYVFDAAGRLVLQQACKKGINRVSTTGLSAGVYFVKVGGEKMRFVKSR